MSSLKYFFYYFFQFNSVKILLASFSVLIAAALPVFFNTFRQGTPKFTEQYNL